MSNNYVEPTDYALDGYFNGTTLAATIHTLNPGAIVTLYELDATAIGGSISRFHAGTNQLRQAVVWQGNTYTPFPIEVTGFDISGKGQLPRPVVRVANVNGLLGALVRDYDDLIGAKLTRKRTLARFLDAVNFPGSVNPNADPTAAFPDDVFFIDRKSGENKVAIEFELSASFDVNGVQLPRRYIVQNVCPWRYRVNDQSSACTWVGSTYYDANDQPVGSAAQDVCGKRLSSCQVRFGNGAALPFGGMPAAGLVR